MTILFLVVLATPILAAPDREKSEENKEPKPKEAPKSEVKQEDKSSEWVYQPEKSLRNDSTAFGSVSKFNYIFYFIYKLKYDDLGLSELD